MSLRQNYIVIHHSATVDQLVFNWAAIRKYHIETNGWSAIGYHLGIEKVGSGYEIMIGRFLGEAGAHCKDAGMNQNGVGVCLVGNFDADVPPTEQYDKALNLCSWLMDSLVIPVGHVIGHREAQAMGGVPSVQRKSCPGLLLDMDLFRARLAQKISRRAII